MEDRGELGPGFACRRLALRQQTSLVLVYGRMPLCIPPLCDQTKISALSLFNEPSALINKFMEGIGNPSVDLFLLTHDCLEGKKGCCRKTHLLFCYSCVAKRLRNSFPVYHGQVQCRWYGKKDRTRHAQF